MDDTHFVDDFGNLKKRKDLSDWSAYEPWQFWGARYNWIECDQDLQDFDRICWRDNVHVQTAYGEAWHNGARFIIGEIRKIKDSKRGMLACIVVIHSEGMEPYDHGTEIYRHVRRLSKNGLYRAPRSDEGERWCKTDLHIRSGGLHDTETSRNGTRDRSGDKSGTDKKQPRPSSKFLNNASGLPRSGKPPTPK